jgi:hypothetical protein
MLGYVGAALCLLSQQVGSPTVFRPRWAVEGATIAVREGMMPEYFYGIYKVRTLDFRSRYEFAVYLHASVTKQVERTENALDGDAADLERASLIRAGSLLPFYRRGAKELARELKSLGIEGDFGISRLEALLNRLERQSPRRALPFADLPSDHWAAKAVGDLRALGMLDGYPDGRYHG